MAKDVKIEVLYYKTATDISLEFGLHGNYPLRILSSTCNDINEFFRALKRAVSRSEIILTVGGYQSDDYLPDFIARAIGKRCTTPDYRKAGVITSNNYPIPEGSAPLAAKSRLFGGFLIESGPQTIISLVDDRKTRLSVINEFVVDYITEHHNVFNQPFGVKVGVAPKPEVTEFSDVASSSEPTVEPSAETEDITAVDTDGAQERALFDTTDANDVENAEDTPLVLEDVTLNSDNPAPDTEEVASFEDTHEETEPIAVEDESIPLAEPTVTDNFTFDEFKEEDLLKDEAAEESDDDDNEFIEKEYYCEDYFSEKHRTRRKKRIVRLVCLILSLLIILGAVVGDYLLSKPTSTEPKDYYDSLSSMYYSYGSDISAGFNAVKKQNDTCFTWLNFDKVNIDHPVFTVGNTENNAFLNQLPNGISDTRGMLFSSTAESVATANNITIFGNADFGGLFQELSASVQTDPGYLLGSEFTASDNRFSASWQVFSVFTHSSVEDYDYSNTTFADDEEYSAHLLKLQQLSFQEYSYEFFGKESLLFLVGISDTERYIVIAYLKSIRVLSFTGDHTDNSGLSNSTSSPSDGNSSVATPSEPTVGEAEGDDDFHGESPDIVLPLPPISSGTSSTTSSTNSSTTTSSEASSVTSSETQSVVSSQNSSTVSSSVSSDVSSDTSSVTSSENTSTEVSSTTSSSVSSSVTSSEPSSVSSATSSESVSSTVSSENSSSTTSSEEANPPVDPIYTWDVELSCKDNATGIVYTGSAVNIVAMIIEDEMSPTIDPPEALIAQSIVKYNWLINNGALNKSKPPSNALDPNPTPQAIQYATAAKGMVLMYGNTLAKTYCYAYSAGKTACYQDIWGGTAYPYLQSVDCPVDENLKDFKTSTTYTSDKIKSLIKNICGIDVSKMEKSEWLKPIQYDANGLYCLKISIGGKEYNGRYLRDNLLTKTNTGVSTIRSTAYEIVYNKEDDTFTVTCKGYGHGVGFSQRGAKAYALQGWTHEQLLAHFFPGTTLIKN